MQEVKSSYPVDETFDPPSEDYREDPYPYYVRFRREAPVFFAPERNVRVVSRYEDISNIVKDPETFSNALCRSLSSRWSPTSCAGTPSAINIFSRKPSGVGLPKSPKTVRDRRRPRRARGAG